MERKTCAQFGKTRNLNTINFRDTVFSMSTFQKCDNPTGKKQISKKRRVVLSAIMASISALRHHGLQLCCAALHKILGSLLNLKSKSPGRMSPLRPFLVMLQSGKTSPVHEIEKASRLSYL